MKTSLRWAVVVSLAAAANLGVAEVPFTDGDMDVPSGSVEVIQELATVPDEEPGGGSGEPGRAEAFRTELRPVDETAPRSMSEAELWTDRG